MAQLIFCTQDKKRTHADILNQFPWCVVGRDSDVVIWIFEWITTERKEMGLRRKEWQSIRDEEVFPIVLCSRRQAWTEGRSGLGRTQDKLGLDSIPDHQNFEQAPAVGRVLRRGGWGWRLVRWLEMLSSLQSRCFVFKVYRSGFFCALATLDVKL